MIRSRYQMNLLNRKPHIYFCEYYGRWLFSPVLKDFDWLIKAYINSKANSFCTQLNKQRHETTTKKGG